MENITFYEFKEKITNAAFGKNNQCFLLIDSTLKNYQSDTSLYDTLKNFKSYTVNFHQQDLNEALHLSLFPLSAMNNEDNELLDKSIHHSLNEHKIENLDSGEGLSVCAWISTELTGEQLAEQIASSAVQSVTSGIDILIRYFDPSVFSPLMLMLDSWQIQQLLSNINTWSYIDGDCIAQVVNGDGECKRKLNYSLGLTDLNLSEMNNVSVINVILREYRKMEFINKLSERSAVMLLYPALSYFYSFFSASESDVIEFGLDVLFTQRLFYQDEVFDKYVNDNSSQKLLSYHAIKPMILNEK